MRGNRMAMIFQEPMTSLNPALRIGDQLGEGVRNHQKVSRAQARARAIEVLDLVGIPNARERVDSYPHEFSGGMLQRVMIRSEERRVGKECVSTCMSRCSPYH